MSLMVRSPGQPGWPTWLRRKIGGHWFRPDHRSDRWAADEPCALKGCERRGREHWRWCGEWMLPRRERWRLSLSRMLATVRAGTSGVTP